MSNDFRVLVATDGSPSAQAGLAAVLPASTRARIRAGIAELDERRLYRARRQTDTAAETVRRAGWRVRTEVGTGAPLAMLLDVAAAYHGHVLFVGARAKGAVESLFIGSIAGWRPQHLANSRHDRSLIA